MCNLLENCHIFVYKLVCKIVYKRQTYVSVTYEILLLLIIHNLRYKNIMDNINSVVNVRTLVYLNL